MVLLYNPQLLLFFHMTDIPFASEDDANGHNWIIINQELSDDDNKMGIIVNEILIYEEDLQYFDKDPQLYTTGRRQITLNDEFFVSIKNGGNETSFRRSYYPQDFFPTIPDEHKFRESIVVTTILNNNESVSALYSLSDDKLQLTAIKIHFLKTGLVYEEDVFEDKNSSVDFRKLELKKNKWMSIVRQSDDSTNKKSRTIGLFKLIDEAEPQLLDSSSTYTFPTILDESLIYRFGDPNYSDWCMNIQDQTIWPIKLIPDKNL